MNVAVLFNSDATKYNGYYGWPIKSSVFKTGVIQKSQRHMKMAVGDVLIYSKSRSWEEYDLLSERVYFTGPWSLILEERLRATFRTATVYALVFENMTREIAEELHRALLEDDAYLGLLQVHFDYGPHLAFFRNYMILKYRLQGEACRIFYAMGGEEEKDEYELESLKKLGFQDIGWEDKGAHKTIFDDFDHLEHFRQIADFRKTVAPFLPGGEDDASELVMVLEDLNPQLFNALGSAVEALTRARHDDHLAQAALSGRRYLERLANVLFPPRDAPYNGKKVGLEQYRNRIWAYISDHVGQDLERRDKLGKTVDRLVNEFNAGLHSSKDKERMLQGLVDLASLSAALLALDPEGARKPYFAFQQRIIDFLKDSAEQHHSSMKHTR